MRKFILAIRRAWRKSQPVSHPQRTPQVTGRMVMRMKVSITSIKIATRRTDAGWIEEPNLRNVESRVLDEHKATAAFVLPAIEVDGLIVVGGTYELIFARRES
jgi:hypothetical protein